MTRIVRHQEALTLAWAVEAIEDHAPHHEVLHVHKEIHSATITILTETNEEVEMTEGTVESALTLLNVVHNFLKLLTGTDPQSRG